MIPNRLSTSSAAPSVTAKVTPSTTPRTESASGAGAPKLDTRPVARPVVDGFQTARGAGARSRSDLFARASNLARAADAFLSKPAGQRDLSALQGAFRRATDAFDSSRSPFGSRLGGPTGGFMHGTWGTGSTSGLTSEASKTISSLNTGLAGTIGSLTGTVPTKISNDPTKTLLSYSKQLFKLSTDPTTQKLGQSLGVSTSLTDTKTQLADLLATASGRTAKRIQKSMMYLDRAAENFASPIQDRDMVP